MRINRLDLTRYGKFTDHVIDFGQADASAPDLHLIYGPNEAGKSTLFTAWLDLLFGIATNSRYNFTHPYSAMRIGASIELEDGPKDFVRIKQPKSSLIDASGRPVSESTLSAALGGLERDSYLTMFSLNDETLEKGGEAILASKGNLGELLFSASAGLGELSRNLEQIREETDNFYRFRAHSSQLAELKSRLTDLRDKREDLDTQASDHARWTTEHKEASARHAEASLERKKLDTRRTRINQLLQAQPRLEELTRLERTAESLENVSEVVPEWREQIRKLSQDDAGLEASGTALQAEIDRLTEEQASIETDPGILELEIRLSELEAIRARHDTAQDDLPERRAELARMDGQIGQLLTRLGRGGETDAGRLLLDAATHADLDELITARASLDVLLATARKEVATAQENFDKARAHLAELGDAGEDRPDQRDDHVATLSHLVAELRNGDHGPRCQAAQSAISAAREKLQIRIGALAPWQGDAIELDTMAPPSRDMIADWKRERDEIIQKRASNDDDIARHSALIKRYESEARAIAQTHNLSTSDETQALLSARNAAWARHKTSLDTGTATAFETAMHNHDSAVDTRANHHGDVARLNESARQNALAQADLEAANAARAKLDTRHDKLQTGIAKAVVALSPKLSTDMTPGGLEDWLDRRAEALETNAELGGHIRQLKQADEDRQAAAQRLREALTPLGLPTTGKNAFEILIAHAQHLIDREASLSVQRSQAAQFARVLKTRQKEQRKTDEDLQAWQLGWKSACARCWLGQADRPPTADQVRGILPLLGELASLLHDRAGLSDRIAKMERDQDAYLSKLHGIADDAGAQTTDMPATDMPAAAIAHKLSARLADAKTAKSRHEALDGQIDDTRSRKRDQSEKLAAHSKIRDQMLAALDAKTLTDASLRVDKALERKRLEDDITRIRDQIRESLNASSIKDALAQATQADTSALNAEKLQLETRLETLDTDVQELFANRQTAAARLDGIGGDDAVALIDQQRTTTLEEMADGARHYLRLSAGVVAMEQALALYREEHRSSMMARASDAIKTISRGRYTGLTTQPDNDQERLVALTSDGGSLQVNDKELSKGTRFQFYLALRVAGYHEFARSRLTVPFIADDIMETFDDFRAEETFRLFADMAGVGQVIYLTHHRHLCDIARSVCPNVHIHELSASR